VSEGDDQTPQPDPPIQCVNIRKTTRRVTSLELALIQERVIEGNATADDAVRLDQVVRDAFELVSRLNRTIERVRAAIESERSGALESEAMDGRRSSHDARLNTCAHIEAALREPPEHGISDLAEETP